MINIPARYEPNGSAQSGGMSHATICRDTHLDRDVLVKELQSGIDQRRIIDEIAALTQIRSKHVVQIYDIIRDDEGQIAGLVEEYIPGRDLNSVIPIQDIDTFFRIAYSIACGLSDIHKADRVHRDIKPGNMKFDAENCLKIFDFGLARNRNVGASTLGPVGTQGYMAPEICVDEDETAEFDSSIDVYAFAATMLKLCKGVLPRALRLFPPQLPCKDADFQHLQFQVPMEVSALLSKCFEEEPAQRPSMDVIRDLISAHILRDRHRAVFVVQGTIYVLHKLRRSVTVTLPGGATRLDYDGLRFYISKVSGEIYVNNVAVGAHQVLPRSSVVTFGGPSLGASRVHVPIDISHPEVLL